MLWTSARLATPGPLKHLWYVVLEEEQVRPVSVSQPHQIMTRQQWYELSQHSWTAASTGGVHCPHPSHHLRQTSHVQHQVLLLLVLQVHDVGEVSQAWSAVVSVERPVRILQWESWIVVFNDSCYLTSELVGVIRRYCTNSGQVGTLILCRVFSTFTWPFLFLFLPGIFTSITASFLTRPRVLAIFLYMV